MRLNKESILAKLASLTVQAVEVPELGGTVHVRPMSLGGMARMQVAMKRKPIVAEGEVSEEAVRIQAVVVPTIILADCLCDEEGKRLFAPGDEALLADLPSGVVTRLVDVIQELSGVNNPEAAKDAAGE